jgi:signal peptidase
VTEPVTDAPEAGAPRARTGLAACVGAVLRTAAAVVLISYASLAIIATLPVALGWNSSVVMSGSMRPGFQPGDVVLSSPVEVANLVPGQVLLVDDPARGGHLLMHRYARPGPAGSLITQGDANRSADSTPVPAKNVRGLPRLRVPWIGRPVLWLRLHALVPLAAMALLGSALLWLVVGGPRAPSTRPPPNGRVARFRRRLPIAAAVYAAVIGPLLMPGADATFLARIDNPSTLATPPSFYAAQLTADGATGAWRFSEASGAVADDGIGSNDGTYTGPVTHSVPGATTDGNTATRYGGAGYLTVPRPFSNSFSIELWFKSSGGRGTSGGSWYDAAPLVDMNNNSSGDFGLMIDEGGHLVAGVTAGGVRRELMSAGLSFTDGGWHHVVMTRDGATGDLALIMDDAVKISTGGPTGAINSLSNITIDSDASDPASSYAGATVIDEVSMYSTALTWAQTSQHYAARANGTYPAAVVSTSPMPVGYWRLDDTSGTTANATIGGAGTYTGFPVFSVAPAITGGTAVSFIRNAVVPRLVSADLSLEFWFASTGGTGAAPWFDGDMLIDGEVHVVSGDLGVTLDATGHVMAGGGGTISSASGGYNDGGWHYVVMTRKQSTGVLTLYVDGAQVATAATGYTGLLNAPLNFYLGSSYIAPTTIDEFAQYPLVLTSTQVAAHYARATAP